MSGVRISDGSPNYIYSKISRSSRTHDGEVSEWFKELVLKTSDSERGRGFESHPLRQRSGTEITVWYYAETIKFSLEKYSSG